MEWWLWAYGKGRLCGRGTWHEGGGVVCFDDGCVGCVAVRGVQVQRAWTDWADGGTGDGVGVGHVGCVQDEWWCGWAHGAGCDGGRTGRVAHGEPVIGWKHGIERGGDQRGEDGGRERDRERGGLRDKQVVWISYSI